MMPIGTTTFCGEFCLLWRGFRAEVWQSTEEGKPLERLVLALDVDGKRPPGMTWRWQLYRPSDARAKQGYAPTRLDARIAARNVATGSTTRLGFEEVKIDCADEPLRKG